MGTEFQYAINPLAESRKNISFTVGRLDDWDYLKGKNRKGDTHNSDVLINFEDSMDKTLEKENIESIKRTMLTQENIFKHQVSELHRLYNMQKILMNETRNEISKIIEDHIPMTKSFDLKKPKAEEKGQLNVQSSQIPRLSVWVGSDTSATNRAIDDEEHHEQTQRVHNHSIYMSMENNNNNCNKDGGGYEECDVDLALGIGAKKKKLKTEANSSSSSNQKTNLPHWLYKGLGSNKT